MKPVRLRPRADRDVDLAFADILDDSGPAAAAKLLREMQEALDRISEYPRIGSPRYARLLKGLRFWRLRRFPFLVFYVEQARFIDVIRVLHGARDIPAVLRESFGSEGAT